MARSSTPTQAAPVLPTSASVASTARSGATAPSRADGSRRRPIGVATRRVSDVADDAATTACACATAEGATCVVVARGATTAITRTGSRVIGAARTCGLGTTSTTRHASVSKAGRGATGHGSTAPRGPPGAHGRPPVAAPATSLMAARTIGRRPASARACMAVGTSGTVASVGVAAPTASHGTSRRTAARTASVLGTATAVAHGSRLAVATRRCRTSVSASGTSISAISAPGVSGPPTACP